MLTTHFIYNCLEGAVICNCSAPLLLPATLVSSPELSLDSAAAIVVTSIVL